MVILLMNNKIVPRVYKILFSYETGFFLRLLNKNHQKHIVFVFKFYLHINTLLKKNKRLYLIKIGYN